MCAVGDVCKQYKNITSRPVFYNPGLCTDMNYNFVFDVKFHVEAVYSFQTECKGTISCL